MSVQLALPVARSIEEVRVVQPFGVAGARYGGFGLAGHNGLDFAAEEGELVLAVDDGDVVEVRADTRGYGVTVKIAHDWGESRYAHGLPRSVPVAFGLGWRVRRGERVLQAAGPHVHLGVRLWDEPGPEGFGGWTDPAPHLGLAPSAAAAIASRSAKRR
ncbi:MAG TPA: M23 family metallopeptidase [Chloroflexota bacterium]|nr:M23 family metallopeptidase [Chloroflexota bacterium]